MTEGISTSQTALQTALEKSAKRGGTSPRAYLLEKIGTSDAGQRMALEEKLQGLEKAHEAMQQSRQDRAAARKEAARRKIAQIKAQMQALQLSISGNAESRARKIARLARELAAAVKAYKAAGGQGNMIAAGIGGSASKAVTETPVFASGQAGAPPSAPDESVALQTSVSLSIDLVGMDMRKGDHADSKAEREADRAFAEEVRRLIRQLKNMQRRDEKNGETGRHLGQALRALSGLGIAPQAAALSSLDVTV